MFELFSTTDLSQSQLSHQYKEKHATFLYRMLATGELFTPLHKAGVEAVGQNTQPNPERTRMAAIMAGPSTAVKVLNSILCELGKEFKGTKTVLTDSL